MHTRSKWLLGILAALALVLTGCSAPSTEADQVIVHKGGGITEGAEDKGCIPAATREIFWGTGMGDNYFRYPSSQRYYDFLKGQDQGSDANPFQVISKDGQTLTWPGQTFFTLNTDCETLTKFHDLIANREAAYLNEDGSLQPGWSRVLNTYFNQPIDRALDIVAKKYTWQELRTDVSIPNEAADAVNKALAREVNAAIAGDGDYFLNWSTRLKQPVVGADLQKTIEQETATVAAARSQEAKAVAEANAAKAAADAQVAQKQAEQKVKAIEAAIRRTEVASFGGPEAYAKYQAVQKGLNPWQPSYSNQLVQP